MDKLENLPQLDECYGCESAWPDYVCANMFEKSLLTDYVPIESLRDLFGYQRIGSVYDIENAIDLHAGWLQN